MSSTAPTATRSPGIAARTAELFKEQQHSITRHTDLICARLMICQWAFGVVLALWISPRAWSGSESHIHLHVWAAIFLGGAISGVPILLGLLHPGKTLTRHTIAIGQMLMSALLIHLTGGRIETHFHVFGSLAILAFYRDWRVLISASVVVYVDHVLRGMFWAQSVYGVLQAPIWRSLEHAGWVIFEVTFLIISIRKSLSEMFIVAERQANLEAMKASIEHTVEQRTVELRKSESLLEQAQQIARLGSWEWDIVADKVTWSEETRRLYGHAPGDIGFTMKRCFDRVHPDDHERAWRVIEDATKSGGHFVCDHRVVLPDGTERIIHGRGEVILDERKQPVRIIGTAQDVTERVRAEEALRRSEEQLRQSQKMEAVGRLAGGVAHDFNNLLTVIGGYCDLLLRQVNGNDKLRADAEEIQRASDRAAALTRQLLAFSRKQVLQPRVIDINEIVGGMEKMLRRLIGEDVDLRTVFDAKLGQIKADPGQMEQVVLNLVVNARDAMPRGGKLTVETANVYIDQKTTFRNRGLDPGEYVMLAISDTGVGMTDEVKAHLFEPFFSTKGVGKGTGLGLATCYGIITQSEGDIRVYSEPGCGTTFKIYLPRVRQSATAAPIAREPSDLPRGSESILIVQDDIAVRRLATSVLRSCGYEVQEAANAIEALGLIDAQLRFDLVITDVIMPQMSGKELYTQLIDRVPQTKVLFISGYTDDALAHHGVLDEDLQFLEKPFSPAGLAQKIREVLDKTPALLAV